VEGFVILIWAVILAPTVGFFAYLVAGVMLQLLLGEAIKVESISNFSPQQKRTVLNTRLKRVLYRSHAIGMGTFAAPFLLAGFGLMIQGPIVAWGWAVEHASAPWFALIALAGACLLHQLHRVARPVAGLVEMAFGVCLIVAYVRAPEAGEAAGSLRLLAVIAGTYAVVQGMEKFDQGRTVENTLQNGGWLGVRLAALYDIVVNWDLSTWRDRKKYRLVMK